MWFTSRTTNILPALCLLGATIPHEATGQAVFKTEVEMVALTVTVTDGKGQPVSGLTAHNFAVFEDGVQQTVSLFGSDEIPVDVALVLDTSSSMINALPIVKTAAHGLVGRLRTIDRAAVIDVKATIRIPQSFTADRASVIAAVDALSGRGSTALYDGMYTALREFERERRRHHDLRRQALVVLSDGVDTCSHVMFDDVTELARTLDVTIYTITLRDKGSTAAQPQLDEGPVRRGTWEMRTLATQTGGLVFVTINAMELQGIYDTIARELTNQYALGYMSSAPRQAQAFRRVALKVLPPGQGIARTRTGYISNGSALSRIAAPSRHER